MNIPSRILGAAALVPIFGFTCGALAAATIDTTPVTGGTEDYLSDIPAQHQQNVSLEQAKAMKGKADHYPLETADGTIEVAELAYHGRLRNRLPERALYETRYGNGYIHEASSYEAERYAAPIPEMQWPVDPGAVTSVSPHDGPPLDVERANAEPVRTEVAYREAPKGGPRVIDVSAELASHH